MMVVASVEDDQAVEEEDPDQGVELLEDAVLRPIHLWERQDHSVDQSLAVLNDQVHHEERNQSLDQDHNVWESPCKVINNAKVPTI